MQHGLVKAFSIVQCLVWIISLPYQKNDASASQRQTSATNFFHSRHRCSLSRVKNVHPKKKNYYANLFSIKYPQTTLLFHISSKRYRNICNKVKRERIPKKKSHIVCEAVVKNQCLESRAAFFYCYSRKKSFAFKHTYTSNLSLNS